MSLAGLVVIWIVSIFLTGLIAHRNGRSAVSWMFFALIGGPIAFLAVLMAGRTLTNRAAGMLADVSTMTCTGCGKLVPTGTSNCPYCGHSMTETQNISVPIADDARPALQDDSASGEIDEEAFQRWFKAGPFADSELSPDAILALRDMYVRELRAGSALDTPPSPTA